MTITKKFSALNIMVEGIEERTKIARSVLLELLPVSRFNRYNNFAQFALIFLRENLII